MNKLLYCFFLSFSVMATSACTDDKEERELPPAPDFSLMILKENRTVTEATYYAPILMYTITIN